MLTLSQFAGMVTDRHRMVRNHKFINKRDRIIAISFSFCIEPKGLEILRYLSFAVCLVIETLEVFLKQGCYFKGTVHWMGTSGV